MRLRTGQPLGKLKAKLGARWFDTPNCLRGVIGLLAAHRAPSLRALPSLYGNVIRMMYRMLL